jgi:hypothetical protein
VNLKYQTIFTPAKALATGVVNQQQGTTYPQFHHDLVGG